MQPIAHGANAAAEGLPTVQSDMTEAIYVPRCISIAFHRGIFGNKKSWLEVAHDLDAVIERIQASVPERSFKLERVAV